MHLLFFFFRTGHAFSFFFFFNSVLRLKPHLRTCFSPFFFRFSIEHCEVSTSPHSIFLIYCFLFALSLYFIEFEPEHLSFSGVKCLTRTKHNTGRRVLEDRLENKRKTLHCCHVTCDTHLSDSIAMFYSILPFILPLAFKVVLSFSVNLNPAIRNASHLI